MVFVSIAHGQYYVSTSGYDGNSGISSGSPWATIEHAVSSTSSGATIYLKRGDTWNQGLNASGWSYRTFSAYGSGARPIIDARDIVSGSTFSGSGPYTLYRTQHPMRVWVNDVEICQSSLQVNGGALTSYRQWQFSTSGDPNSYYSGNPGTLTINNANVPSGTVKIAWGSSHPYALRFSGSSHLRFQSIEFKGGQFTIAWSGGSYIRFDSCSIGSGAGAYAIRNDSYSTYDTLTNCVVDRTDTLRHYEYEEGPPNYTVHGDIPSTGAGDCVYLSNCDHWYINHNVIANWGHCGINMLGAGIGSGNVTANNIEVSWNELYQAGNSDYGGAIQTQATSSGTVHDINVHHNYIHHCHSGFQYGGNNIVVQYNVIDTCFNTAWQTDEGEGNVVGFGSYMWSTDNYFTNNIVMNADGVAVVEKGHGTAGSSNNNNVLLHNIFYNNGRWTVVPVLANDQLQDHEYWTFGSTGDVFTSDLFYNSRSSVPMNKDNSSYSVTSYSWVPSGSSASGCVQSNPNFNTASDMTRYEVQAGSPALSMGFTNFDLTGVGVASTPTYPQTTLVTPGNGATSVSTSASLQWTSVSGATGYTAYIVGPSDTIVASTPSTVASASLTANTNYTWYVVTSFSSGTSQSTASSFSTVGLPRTWKYQIWKR